MQNCKCSAARAFIRCIPKYCWTLPGCSSTRECTLQSRLAGNNPWPPRIWKPGSGAAAPLECRAPDFSPVIPPGEGNTYGRGRRPPGHGRRRQHRTMCASRIHLNPKECDHVFKPLGIHPRARQPAPRRAYVAPRRALEGVFWTPNASPTINEHRNP